MNHESLAAITDPIADELRKLSQDKTLNVLWLRVEIAKIVLRLNRNVLELAKDELAVANAALIIAESELLDD